MDHGVIEVETKFFFLAFLLMLFKPRVELDGRPAEERPWGVSPFPVAPGRHRVTVFVPYLFFPRMGAATIDLDVAAGQVVRIRWNAPWLVFLDGTIGVVGPTGYGPTGYGSAPTGGVRSQGDYDRVTYGQPAGYHQSAGYTAAPGWFADPKGAHELRYFDGQRWTEHVSDRGTASIDAL